MALSTLSTVAMAGSTLVITAQMTDEDGNAIPDEDIDSLTWTLTDTSGNVVNNRQDVAISSPAASQDIILSGDDLAVDGLSRVTRVLTLAGTYTSDLGAGMPLTGGILFEIEPLPGWPRGL